MFEILESIVAVEDTPRPAGEERGLQVGVTPRSHPRYRGRGQRPRAKPRATAKTKARTKAETPGRLVVPITHGRPHRGARPRNGLSRRRLRLHHGNGQTIAGIINGSIYLFISEGHTALCSQPTDRMRPRPGMGGVDICAVRHTFFAMHCLHCLQLHLVIRVCFAQIVYAGAD